MSKKKQTDTKKYIAELINLNEKRTGKYTRNFRWMNSTPYATDRTIKDQSVLGWYSGIGANGEQDTTRPPSINIIRQAVSTLYNKLSEVKVRPFFNVINGTFDDNERAKYTQQYFDIMYDIKNVYRTVSDSFRDACIFDTGNIYIDEVTKKIERILPTYVYTRPSERYYNHITRAYILKKDFPTVLLDEYELTADGEYVDFGIYYDIKNHLKAYTINGTIVKEEKYDKEVVPLVYLYYDTPITGNTISVVDLLIDTQREINQLMTRISDCSQKTMPNIVIVPTGSNVQIDSLSNRAAQIIRYNPAPGVSNPVSTITNDFISPQYMDTVKELIEQGFAQIGLSQLSTQAKKPSGLDSGIALDSYENIESDRHEAILSQIVRAYVDIAKICIQVFEGDILPKKDNRLGITWEDIKKSADTMNIQFSAAESLSKDPSEKLKQLQAMAQAGIIPKSRIAQLMELPDLETGFSFSTNVVNAAQRLISNTIKNNKVELPEGDYIPFVIIKEEIINCQNNLYANNKDGKNDTSIAILNKLYNAVIKREKKYQQPTQQEQEGEGELPTQENILTQEAGIEAKADDDGGDWTTDTIQQQ